MCHASIAFDVDAYNHSAFDWLQVLLYSVISGQKVVLLPEELQIAELSS
jgi:hypothetical protein